MKEHQRMEGKEPWRDDYLRCCSANAAVGYTRRRWPVWMPNRK